MGRADKKIKVVYFNRKPRKLGNFSIEIFYDLVRRHLQPPFEPVYREMPYYNEGFFKRLGNALYCMFHQGDINHITGDIHYTAIFLKKQKTVLTVLDCGMLHQSTGIKHRIFKWIWFKIPVQRSALITCISQATKDDVIHFTGCDERKVKVVYVSINQIFTPSPKTFNKTAPRILQLGTAINKNLERLVKSLEGIPCKLVIIGKVSAELSQLLQQHYVDYEIIDWRLTDEEVLEEYRKCDILTFISTLEGFGMPIVEANATGRVVITGNVTSMPEVAGNAAHLVDPLSVEDMRQGFLKIIYDDAYRSQLVENGYVNSLRFSIEKITAQYMELYQQMLGRTDITPATVLKNSTVSK